MESNRHSSLSSKPWPRKKNSRENSKKAMTPGNSPMKKVCDQTSSKISYPSLSKNRQIFRVLI